MPKDSDGTIAIVALIALAAWLLIGLPLLYLPDQGHVHGELLGVKYGEWLLFLATVALFLATWRLATGAGKTAERQLRAYVSGDGGSFQLIETDKGRRFIQGHYTLKNFGQTPAYRVRLWVRLDILPADTLEFQQSVSLSESILGPGATAENSPVRGPITDADLAAIRSGDKRIFIWGEALYVDAFGNDRYLRFYDINGREFQTGRWPISNSDKPYEAN